MNRDKEEFKEWMIEAHGSEVADAFFGAIESLEVKERLQRIKEKTRASAENSRHRHQGKTRVVRKVDLDPRLNGKSIIRENGDRGSSEKQIVNKIGTILENAICLERL
ncbi:hypothetical protein [Bacillus sp. FSL M8-0168]|uniref:hypothetical protein n=1 Tax=Bacillus sp. FSL M8-0168 TaxID=2921614 RepID=UPI0030FDC3B8